MDFFVYINKWFTPKLETIDGFGKTLKTGNNFLKMARTSETEQTCKLLSFTSNVLTQTLLSSGFVFQIENLKSKTHFKKKLSLKRAKHVQSAFVEFKSSKFCQVRF
jgi:hypothetical protein